jgi:hypothetical protein
MAFCSRKMYKCDKALCMPFVPARRVQGHIACSSAPRLRQTDPHWPPSWVLCKRARHGVPTRTHSALACSAVPRCSAVASAVALDVATKRPTRAPLCALRCPGCANCCQPNSGTTLAQQRMAHVTEVAHWCGPTGSRKSQLAILHACCSTGQKLTSCHPHWRIIITVLLALGGDTASALVHTRPLF